MIYDVAPPYRDNWTFFQTILNTSEAKGRKFVITTANARLLREVAGRSADFLELSEKPDNVQAIVDAVQRV
jgi:hypothetical protein